MSDRDTIRNAVADLRAKLDALSDDLGAEPFDTSHQGILRTQTYIGRWSRKHLIEKMVGLILAIEDAGCDEAPDFVETRSELTSKIEEALVNLYHEPHEKVRELAAEGRSAYGRAESAADTAHDDRRAA